MMKTIGRLWGAACILAISGCADVTFPRSRLSVNPVVTTVTMATCDGTVPCYASMAAVPPETLLPEIYTVSPVVYWEYQNAVGSSRMTYYGNRAEESFVLEISGPSNASRTAIATSQPSFFPQYNVHVTPGFRLGADGDCGHRADLHSQHTAKSVLFVEYRGLTEVSVSRAGGDDDRQAECIEEPCPVNNFENALYNAYDPGGCDGGGAGGGGSTASGTAYAVGDYTGGETVDWGTGVGNGGASGCGTYAKVERVCFEYMSDLEGWIQVCGFATMC